MKIVYTPKPETSRLINLVLFCVIIAMAMLILIGSVFALFRSKDAKPILTLGKQDKTEQVKRSSGKNARDADIRVFSGLGRLRIPLTNSSIMLLTISFPYPANDVTFTEELAARIGDFRNIATTYFASLPADKLVKLDEEAAKQEILRRYNGILRLGRISAIYFSDMMILEGQ
jgi:flagellar basal body-associated protein FliL